MSIDPIIITSLLGLLGTVWAAWVTYRGVVGKNRGDAQAHNFLAQQSEIDRLREDLEDRDLESRSRHVEIVKLRSEVHETMIEVYKLRASLSEVLAGAAMLYGQLVDKGEVPFFNPAKLIQDFHDQGDKP